MNRLAKLYIGRTLKYDKLSHQGFILANIDHKKSNVFKRMDLVDGRWQTKTTTTYKNNNYKRTSFILKRWRQIGQYL